MATNSGTKILTLIGDVPDFGEVWYDPSSMANIIGFRSLAKKHKITYETNNDTFIVHMGKKAIRFVGTSQDLYVWDKTAELKKQVAKHKKMELPRERVEVTHVEVDKSLVEEDTTQAEEQDIEDSSELEMQALISSVAENRKNFTQRQYDDAMKARKLYHAIGCPTVENFKAILRQNIIKNCPVTAADVDIAEKLFGPDIGALKGKSTRPTSPVVKDDLIEIPKEIKELHQDLILCIDIMFINGLPMLTCIDRSLRFRSLVTMEDRTTPSIYDALDKVLRLYNRAGHSIKEMHCDQEFKKVMDEIADNLDVQMNYTTTDEHVPEAERNNRTIQERYRSAYHNMPFKVIPKVMIKHLAMVSCDQLNMFPAKGGVSPYLSPHVILTGRAIDYEKHCKIPFGAYVQANNQSLPTNTNAPRTIDCIYLRPTNNKQGGHELMDLASGRVITRPRVIEIPITQVVINAVEKMAIKQGIKTLKLVNRNGQVLPLADHIAGVVVDHPDENPEADDEADEDFEDPENEDDESVYDPDQDFDNDKWFDAIQPSEIKDIKADWELAK